ncbi:MAG: ABC transporter ATP-binding protein [Lachnospiraceae bacterium]|nr:ABC transporter ATP-binding protein [Lachnospiraceae bacterium]
MENTNLILDEDEVLRVKDLSINFGGLKAVDNLSFSIKKNQVFGLIGPNGAGKTTCFNCITQFYRPTTGSVLFRTKNGNVEELVGQNVHDIIKKGLVRTFQNVELIPELSVMENVLLGAHVDFKSSLFAQALKLPKARKEEQEFRERTMDVLEFMGIADYANSLCSGLPYGVRKKVEMARTLLCDPKLIIFDEPAAGLNDVETDELTLHIRQIMEKYQCSIFLVEHDMGLVMNVCDRICAISFGKFLAEGTPAEIQKNKLVQEAYLGEEG